MHLITLLIISQKKRKETFKQNVSVISTRFISFDSLPGAVQEKTCRKNSEWTDFIPSILVSFCLFPLNIITEVGKINWNELWVEYC